MKSVRMRMRLRVRSYGLLLTFGLWVLEPGSARAEPSAECRDLAARFATAAAALDLGALAGLMMCVSTEIQGRMGGTALPPPPSPPEVAPPPPPTPLPSLPPPPASERISAFRPTWPASAPWGGEWSEKGWGD